MSTSGFPILVVYSILHFIACVDSSRMPDAHLFDLYIASDYPSISNENHISDVYKIHNYAKSIEVSTKLQFSNEMEFWINS